MTVYELYKRCFKLYYDKDLDEEYFNYDNENNKYIFSYDLNQYIEYISLMNVFIGDMLELAMSISFTAKHANPYDTEWSLSGNFAKDISIYEFRDYSDEELLLYLKMRM